MCLIRGAGRFCGCLRLDDRIGLVHVVTLRDTLSLVGNRTKHYVIGSLSLGDTIFIANKNNIDMYQVAKGGLVIV